MSVEDKNDSGSEYDPEDDDVDSQDSDAETNEDFTEDDDFTPEYTDFLVEEVTQELIDHLESREVRYTVV